MTKPWVIRAGLGLLGWAGIGLGVAQAADILPVATPTAPLGSFPYTVKSPSAVTLAIFKDGLDKTATWLPTPGEGVRLVVKVNGVIQTPTPPITLVPPATSVAFGGVDNPFLKAGVLTTSAYLGECGNTGNPAPLLPDAPDYTLSADGASNVTLTPTDCGGFAVVQVDVPAQGGLFTFIVPQDDNANAIPTHWELTFCPATNPCPTGREDTDPAPVTSVTTGDGHSALDEYRGFRVRGVLTRLDPRHKDLFFFFAGPQCITGTTEADFLGSTLSFFGGGALTFPTDGTAPGTSLTPSALSGTGVTFTAGAPAFAASDVSLGREILVVSASGSVVARAAITGFTSPTVVTADITLAFPSGTIAAGSWRISGLFENLANLFGSAQVHLLHTPGKTNYKSTEWVDNFVRYTTSAGFEFTADGTAEDRRVNKNAVFSGIARGVRGVECVEEGVATVPSSPLAIGGRGINAPGEGFMVLYIRRIIKNLTDLAAAGGSRPLRHSTFVSGAWSTPTLIGNGDPASEVNRNLLISIALKFFTPHEAGGHDGALTAVASASYGYHLAPFTGDVLDQKLTCKVDKSPGGFNTCYIPSIYNSADKEDFQAK